MLYARVALLFAACLLVGPALRAGNDADLLDTLLAARLRQAGFTGKVGVSLEQRLGRSVNRQLANLGRLLWFDKIGGLHDDNSCSGCHSPSRGFGDTQSIAIGVQNNNLVGPNRTGPRNQRRSPMVINAAFFPKLMWNGRFSSVSFDPFDNSEGFSFPPPEGLTRFPPNDPVITHLLMAQAHIPPTELTESPGFTGTKGTIGPSSINSTTGKAHQCRRPTRVVSATTQFGRQFSTVSMQILLTAICSGSAFPRSRWESPSTSACSAAPLPSSSSR
jgi:cytochrome c peroxidase